MNKVFLIGNLTHDPETVKTVNGNNVARFNIAVNRFTRPGEQKTDFFRVTSFGKLAEVVENYLSKGAKIALLGSLNTSEWEDKEGNVHKLVEVVADEIEFLKTKLDEQPKRRPKY